VPGFTYCEDYKYVWDALAREKSLKGLLRAKKIELIESVNPEWDDMAEHWYSELGDSSRS
jgi:putative endonuclease